jgi:hypothetical protein
MFLNFLCLLRGWKKTWGVWWEFFPNHPFSHLDLAQTFFYQKENKKNISVCHLQNNSRAFVWSIIFCLNFHDPTVPHWSTCHFRISSSKNNNEITHKTIWSLKYICKDLSKYTAAQDYLNITTDQIVHKKCLDFIIQTHTKQASDYIIYMTCFKYFKVVYGGNRLDLLRGAYGLA